MSKPRGYYWCLEALIGARRNKNFEKISNVSQNGNGKCEQEPEFQYDFV